MGKTSKASNTHLNTAEEILHGRKCMENILNWQFVP